MEPFPLDVWGATGGKNSKDSYFKKMKYKLCCFILGLLMNQTVMVCGGLLQDNQPTKECYSMLGNHSGKKISMIEARAFAASTVFNHVSTLI